MNNRDIAYPLADIDLARRLEYAEARSNAEFVEAHATALPESGAEWIDVAGTYAMFDGLALHPNLRPWHGPHGHKR